MNFTRGWSGYKKGFGQGSYEHWLGNDLIHALTADHKQTLRVTLKLGVNNPTYAKYAKFWIDNEASNYKLTIGGYAGTAAGMSLSMSHYKSMSSTS